MPSITVLFALVALLLPGPAIAGDIYKWVDEYGRTHFSDTPAAVSPEAREKPRKVEPRAGSVIANPHFNQETVRVPFTSNGANMIVEGSVNGVEARFIVDTGATLVLIPATLAERAGVKTDKAPSIDMQTAGGTIKAPMVSLSSVRIGDAAQTDVAATVYELEGFPGLGLLGMSFLERYGMTVNSGEHILLLEKR